MSESRFDYDELASRLLAKHDDVTRTVARARARAATAEKRLAEMEPEIQELAFREAWEESDGAGLAALRDEQTAAKLAIEDAALVESYAERATAQLMQASREVKRARRDAREPVLRLREWMLND